MVNYGIKEVKTTKDRKSFCAHASVFVLMLVLLLSSMMGTLVWAKGPPTPPPPPPTYEFHIWIGLLGDDVFLSNAPLTVVTDVSSCGWYYPYKKGTRSGFWGVDLNMPVTLPSPVECGIYNVENLEVPPDELDLIDAQSFSISHEWNIRNQRYDFWQFRIIWGLNEEDITATDYRNVRVLAVKTDSDFDPDGTFIPDDPETLEPEDKWIVNFNGASWELIGFEPDPNNPGCYFGYRITGGTIDHGFDVTIKKAT